MLLRPGFPCIRQNTKSTELLLLWLQRFSFWTHNVKDKNMFTNQHRGYLWWRFGHPVNQLLWSLLPEFAHGSIERVCKMTFGSIHEPLLLSSIYRGNFTLSFREQLTYTPHLWAQVRRWRTSDTAAYVQLLLDKQVRGADTCSVLEKVEGQWALISFQPSVSPR